MSRNAKIRLFVDAPLGPGQCVGLTGPQAHYLFGVMRLAAGGRVALFNGRDGEWQAEVTTAHRNRGEVRCLVPSAALSLPPDVWLLFAPLKKARTDYIVEKATELGVRRILPVGTDFTNAERLRRDRLQAHAVEAAEQCGATFVPDVADLVPLRRALDGWDPARRLLWCDEGLAGFVPADPAARTASRTAARAAAGKAADTGAEPAAGGAADTAADTGADPAERVSAHGAAPRANASGAPAPAAAAGAAPGSPPTALRDAPAPAPAPAGGPAAPTGGPWAILIGPEGGFSPAERARIAALPFVHPVRLGPRILRADTAAVAALTWWQITHGDWSAP